MYMENIYTKKKLLFLALLYILGVYLQLLGSGMSNRMWENTVEHAKTCVLGGKLYVHYTEQTQATGVVFNHIYEFQGLIANGHFLSLESLNHDQKVRRVLISSSSLQNLQSQVLKI